MKEKEACQPPNDEDVNVNGEVCGNCVRKTPIDSHEFACDLDGEVVTKDTFACGHFV